MENNEKLIDIRKVIGDKNPNLLKILPNFVINYIKNIVHEDEINAHIANNKDIFGVQFVENTLFDLFGVKIQYQGLENLKNSERYIVASNHPMGGLDGLAIMYVVSKINPNIKVPVNDLLLYIPNLKPIFLPVNKHGKQSSDAAIEMEKAYNSDAAIIYFPAGLASRKINGKIMDLEWKKSFIQKARQYHRDIIPVYISGKNSNFFYNLANFRKKLAIKSNIEMFFLSNEMFKQKDKNIKIIFGEPISYNFFDKSKTDKEWAQYVKDIVYKLSENIDN
ncbi:MAG TPA: 1-acyl-sn-glycerol-3-phosphate acyltransferase [Bacteroidales bacterium]|jgi:putative hemolysin|nr:glycerol acyltransferase [Bacteroidales bacterium]HOK21179.1 1-acyl-sn-glycerol-3-phosphate acyltransferase [Bacteroidales bacterium]HOL74187.1 1-acyl-sn-glycerol-3-phosphate acyltransferase [Bacteroidales bacterium]HPU46407.1 1-acyl-sn-glycerol-3-phosphate acyltransferase [Bacteroidales bacterium]HPZ35617.1 1-acyl-sn-glycerol-3-phosphate acyltransferase [Bacteroidales bacterium]